MDNTVLKVKSVDSNNNAVSKDSFAELIAELCSEWRTFAIAAALVVSISAAYYLMSERIYEAQVAIEVSVNTQGIPKNLQGIVRSPEQMEQYLVEKYDIGNKRKESKEFPIISSVRRLNNIIFISAIGDTPEETYRYLDDISTRFVDRSFAPYQTAIQAQNDYLKNQEQQINELEALLTGVAESSKLSMTKDPTTAALLGIERARVSQQLIDLKAAYENDKMQLISLEESKISVLRRTQLLKNGQPIKPSLFFCAVGGILLGCLAGIAAVVGMHFYRKVRSIQLKKI